MRFAIFAALILLSSYVSSPAHVPNFDNFTTPVLKPGESGTFNFTIQNRYVNTMYNVVLNVGIYEWATEQDHKPIKQVQGAPVIEESGKTNYTIKLGALYPGVNMSVYFRIKTFSDTPDGVYFVRFSLFFDYNSSHYMMWSRGYFSNAVWDNATKNHTLNLTYLSKALGKPVDGIVPDSSFSVQSSLMWVLYVLIGLTAFVGFLAFYSYLKEERITNPADEKYYQLKGKYRKLERELKRKLREKNQ
ncbi:MAG: hypothetical protein GXO25_03420 [Euryarchaeota archaeon]|nr:hypothetical protein [Euryarchaeota archaeon]